jgi:hypothetical protein
MSIRVGSGREAVSAGTPISRVSQPRSQRAFTGGMTDWTPHELERIGSTDDFRISPFRADGETLGTPTWIWSVVVDGAVYVRAYHGTASRWYGSAVSQRAGRITAGGIEKDVAFTPTRNAQLENRIDAAYRDKYAGNPYLPPMLTDRVRAATVRVDPR